MTSWAHAQPGYDFLFGGAFNMNSERPHQLHQRTQVQQAHAAQAGCEQQHAITEGYKRKAEG